VAAWSVVVTDLVDSGDSAEVAGSVEQKREEGGEQSAIPSLASIAFFADRNLGKVALFLNPELRLFGSADSLQTPFRQRIITFTIVVASFNVRVAEYRFPDTWERLTFLVLFLVLWARHMRID
jgi:hypothetical protein